MADENYTLPEVPVYREAIRKILNEDPVNAEEVLNPLVQALLENIAAVKGIADGKVNADLSNVDNTDFMNKASEAGAGGIPIAKIRSEDGKNYTAEIPGITELKNGMMIVVIPNKRNLSGGTGSEVTLTINENPELRSRIRMKLYGSLDMWDNLPSAYFSPEVPFTLKYHSYMGFWAVETHWISEYDITGTIPVSKGGTGATTAEEARNNLGIGNAAGKRTARFTVGTSTAGWTADQVDYLCDGTDDQVEINAAIQALPAAGGEVVILDGTYNLTGPISVNKNNVTLSGNGQSTILKRAFAGTASTGGLIYVTSSYNTVRFLRVDGMESTYSGTYARGISVYNSTGNTITGNVCNNNASRGIYLAKSTGNIITGNTCTNNTKGYGISVTSESNNTITDNICGSNYIGINLNNSFDNVVSGNICNNNGDYGICCTNPGRNTITGNTCNSNQSGIFIYSSTNNTITGNTCDDNEYGIVISSAENNTITGNTCIRGTGTAGDYDTKKGTISVTGNNNLIVGNNIMGKNYTNSGTGNTFANNKYS
ncbi:MAG: hypothetical protein HFF00_04745 [Ruminiclostridium sp.]|jgi:parallel beta-helix repeat protein|nr:hypothetical protein [Ruminiclostridium sp.]